jgi:CheY-like chemotaxis protein
MDNARLFEQSQWVQSELKRSNEELRRANRDLEAFAYSASHDLQEPLRTVAISAQLIERSVGSQLQPQDAAFLQEILTAAKRMSGLISDLLEYTRATKYEQGTPPRVESGPVLKNVLESLGAAIQETGAIVIAEELPEVTIHECRLAQLFQNLISNAIKYRSKEVPCVRVTGDQQDGWIVFSVIDNGIGIEPQYAEQIFGLFKRLHPRSKFPSDWPSASVWSSSMGAVSGSSILKLDKDRPSASPSLPAPEDNGQAGSEATGVDRRLVLLVEDNSTDVFVINRVLEECGLGKYVRVASDGQEAVLYLQKLCEDPSCPEPVLVLLDLNVPKISGIEILRELRGGRLRPTPVIIVTSSVSEGDRSAAESLGAEAYFQKPHDLAEYMKLAGVIKGILGTSMRTR